MEKRIANREFFAGKAEEIARKLLGKFIYCKNVGQAYQIMETEAYYHDEKDSNGNFFCYGVKKDTGENSKTCATAPLFHEPGTWCVYGGQLLLSVTSKDFPDNVLIKRIKTLGGTICKPDRIAEELRLYQKDPQSNYWNFHGLDSLSDEADLYLVERENIPGGKIKSGKRVNINDSHNLNFSMESE